MTCARFDTVGRGHGPTDSGKAMVSGYAFHCCMDLVESGSQPIIASELVLLQTLHHLHTNDNKLVTEEKRKPLNI
jgi:hypothetical protein